MNYLQIARVTNSQGNKQYMSAFGFSKESQKFLNIIGLNPSIIKEGKNATVTQLLKLAVDLGYDSIRIMNLYSDITPNPKNLKNIDTIDNQNLAYLKFMFEVDDVVLCIWGNHANKQVSSYVLQNLKNPQCIGITKSGEPRHILHTKLNSSLIKL
jgi:hypothetical protein